MGGGGPTGKRVVFRVKSEAEVINIPNTDHQVSLHGISENKVLCAPVAICIGASLGETGSCRNKKKQKRIILFIESNFQEN